MEFKNIFQPIKIGKKEIKNRVIFSAIPTKMEEDGFIEDKLIDYYLKRAKNEVDLLILEPTTIDEKNQVKNFLSIGNDKYIKRLAELTDAIHKEGSKLGISLIYGGLLNINDLEARILNSSDYTAENGRKLKEATGEEIKEIIKLFKEAGERADKAGFDLIELNVAHSDILHTFLSAGYNKREDDYGGSLENRARIILEIIKELKESIRDDILISMKIVSQDDGLENGLSIGEVIDFINMAEEVGLDLVTITRGNLTTINKKYIYPSMEIEEGFNLGPIRTIKDKIKLPLVASGRIVRPEMMESIIGEGVADLVGISRGFNIDPKIIKKTREGDYHKVKICIGCNEGCVNIFNNILYKNITCIRNIKIGFDDEIFLTKTKEAKKIAVIGGGVAGMTAAVLLKMKGHEVVLYEKDSSLGGQFKHAIISPNKIEIEKIINRFLKEIKRQDVEVRLNKEFKGEDITNEDIDILVIATGSREKPLEVKGGKNQKVLYGYDVLSKEDKPSGDIVIIGGNVLALELSRILSKENRVVVLHDKEVAKNLGEYRKLAVLDELDGRVKILENVEVLEIKDDRVVYEDKNKKKEVRMDYVISCLGNLSNKSNDLKEYSRDREIPFFVIGDALIPRKALDAIGEAINIATSEID